MLLLFDCIMLHFWINIQNSLDIQYMDLYIRRNPYKEQTLLRLEPPQQYCAKDCERL